MSFTDIAVYMIYEQILPELVMPIDEDYIEILKFLKILSLFQHAGIHHAAVVSGTSFVRSTRGTLDFNVQLFFVLINGVNIKCDVVTINNVAVHIILCLDTEYAKLLIQNNVEYKLDSLAVLIKDASHEVIIKQGKLIYKHIECISVLNCITV